HTGAVANCWSATEAAAFLRRPSPRARRLPRCGRSRSIRACGNQSSRACGGRMSTWRRAVLVAQQMLKGGTKPTFTPTKGKRARTVELAAETVDLLKAHKAHQATLMRYRRQYHDFGLVFAKEWDDDSRRYDVLGAPLDVN